MIVCDNWLLTTNNVCTYDVTCYDSSRRHIFSQQKYVHLATTPSQICDYFSKIAIFDYGYPAVRAWMSVYFLWYVTKMAEQNPVKLSTEIQSSHCDHFKPAGKLICGWTERSAHSWVIETDGYGFKKMKQKIKSKDR